MRKTFIALICIIAVLASGAFARKPPNDITYPVTLEDLGDFIKDLGYSFNKVTTESPEGGSADRIELSIRGDNGTFDIGVQIFESIEMIYISISNYMQVPLSDPGALPMLSYLMNENWNMNFGKFEWDIDDGEVRLSHTLPIDDGISKETFQAYFTAILNMADEKLPELEQNFEDFREE